jgi:hypothetical protein
MNKTLSDQVRAGSWSREIQEHNVGVLLDSFEDDFTSVGGDVEVANVEVGREVRELTLGACFQVDEPEILMLNISAEDHEGTASRKEGEVSSATCQG